MRRNLLALGSRTPGHLRSSGPWSWRGTLRGASALWVPRWALAAARDKTQPNPTSSLTLMISASETQPRGNFDVHAGDTACKINKGGRSIFTTAGQRLLLKRKLPLFLLFTKLRSKKHFFLSKILPAPKQTNQLPEISAPSFRPGRVLAAGRPRICLTEIPRAAIHRTQAGSEGH